MKGYPSKGFTEIIHVETRTFKDNLMPPSSEHRFLPFDPRNPRIHTMNDDSTSCCSLALKKDQDPARCCGRHLGRWHKGRFRPVHVCLPGEDVEDAAAAQSTAGDRHPINRSFGEYNHFLDIPNIPSLITKPMHSRSLWLFDPFYPLRKKRHGRDWCFINWRSLQGYKTPSI